MGYKGFRRGSCSSWKKRADECCRTGKRGKKGADERFQEQNREWTVVDCGYERPFLREKSWPVRQGQLRGSLQVLRRRWQNAGEAVRKTDGMRGMHESGGGADQRRRGAELGLRCQ